jgi:hypothetical protein
MNSIKFVRNVTCQNMHKRWYPFWTSDLLKNYYLGRRGHDRDISWIYSYLCNQCLSPLTLWVRIQLRQDVLDATLCDIVCQLLATGQWFSITNYCILFFYVLTNLIDILHILSLIPKLHVFIPFLIQVLSLTWK